jgi:hypothetical protein
MVIM